MMFDRSPLRVSVHNRAAALVPAALLFFLVIGSAPTLIESFSHCGGDNSECLNGGVCELVQAEVGVYACTCAEGFAGPTCETPIVPCGDLFCANGGICAADGATCECPFNFIGPTCENAIEACPVAGAEDSYCMHGGHCTWTGSQAACQCAPGYAGAQCEDEVLQCSADNWCARGHGVCTSRTNECFCYDDWTGEHCELSVAAVQTQRTVIISASVAGGMAMLLIGMGAFMLVMVKREKQGNPLFHPLLDETEKACSVHSSASSEVEMKAGRAEGDSKLEP